MFFYDMVEKFDFFFLKTLQVSIEKHLNTKLLKNEIFESILAQNYKTLFQNDFNKLMNTHYSFQPTG